MSFDTRAVPQVADQSEAGYTFEPTYPDGRGIGATITVRGPESRAVRDLLTRQLAQLRAREAQARKRGRDAAEPSTLDELEEQAVDLAVAYTIGWAGFVDAGAAMEPTEANLRATYRGYSWIRRQVIDEAQDLGNFTRSSATNSSSTPAPSSISS